MQCYFDTLGVKRKDSLTYINKIYKKLAFKYHPDRNPNNSQEAEIKFKKINEAYIKIKLFKQNIKDNTSFQDDISTFEHFFNQIFNTSLELDKDSIVKNIQYHIAKLKCIYNNIYGKEITEDIVLNSKVSLEDIYNEEDKAIKVVRNNICLNCSISNVNRCTLCQSTRYISNEKIFIFCAAEKTVVFKGESNQEHTKQTGDLIINIIPKEHSLFKIINNYDLLYTIYTSELSDIHHTFSFLDGHTYTFTTKYPWTNRYIIKNKGLYIPYSNERGHLIIIIIYTKYTSDQPFTFVPNL